MPKCPTFAALAGFAALALAAPVHAQTRVQSQILSRSATTPTQSGDARSDSGVGLSADGRFALYRSLASDLDADTLDDNAASDVFLFDRVTGRNELISRRHTLPRRSASGDSFPVALSADGRSVLFRSTAPDVLPITDANGAGADLFLLDRQSGETRLVNRSALSGTSSANAGVVNQALLHPGGSLVAFISSATNLVSGVSFPLPRNQIYLYDVAADSMHMLTTRRSAPTIAADGANLFPHRFSADGQWLLFTADATDLVDGTTVPAGWINLFLFSRDGTTRLLVSRLAADANAGCAAHVRRADMDAAAQRVVFGSECSAHVAGVDSNGEEDIFSFQRSSGSISLLSHAHGVVGQAAAGRSEIPQLAQNGDVLFRSSAGDLLPAGIDTNGTSDVFARLAGGGLELISVAAASVQAGNGQSLVGLSNMSADGRFVAFSSRASDLDAAVSDDNAELDVFLRDRGSATTQLVSTRPGLPLRSGDGLSGLGAAMTPEGSVFIYGTFASTLDATVVDGNGAANPDAYVADFGAIFRDGFDDTPGTR